MSEPAVQKLPVPLAPLGPRPSREPGWGKPLLVGCGLAFVLLLAGSILFLTRQDDLLRWTIDQMAAGVAQRLPADATAQERDSLAAAFAAASQRAEAGDFEAAALQRLQRQFMAAAAKERLSRAELAALAQALEAFAAGPSEAPPTLGD